MSNVHTDCRRKVGMTTAINPVFLTNIHATFPRSATVMKSKGHTYRNGQLIPFQKQRTNSHPKRRGNKNLEHQYRNDNK